MRCPASVHRGFSYARAQAMSWGVGLKTSAISSSSSPSWECCQITSVLMPATLADRAARSWAASWACRTSAGCLRLRVHLTFEQSQIRHLESVLSPPYYVRPDARAGGVRVAAACRAVGARGDRQAQLGELVADRLDPASQESLLVDERADQRRRGSSSPAKKSEASLRTLVDGVPSVAVFLGTAAGSSWARPGWSSAATTSMTTAVVRAGKASTRWSLTDWPMVAASINRDLRTIPPPIAPVMTPRRASSQLCRPTATPRTMAATTQIPMPTRASGSAA